MKENKKTSASERFLTGVCIGILLGAIYALIALPSHGAGW
tara:strand:+ start:554 stop:673 length:120 start_codon:yes stop_codon:yes gene_type:complete